MPSELEAILGFQTLTGVVRAHWDQSPNRYISKTLFTRKKSVLGETAKWHQIKASRELAPFTGADAPPIRVELLGVEEREHGLAHILLSKEIPGRALFQEGWPTEGRQGPGLQLLPNARARIDDERAELMTMVEGAVEYLCAGAVNGRIQVDSTKVPGSKVKFDVQFDSVQTLNAGGAYWGTGSTKILTDTTAGKPSVPNFKLKFDTVAGVPFRRWLGTYKETAKLRNCEEIQKAVRGSVAGAGFTPTTAALRTILLDEGVEWNEYSGVYTKSGVVTRFLTDGTVIGLPADNTFFEMHEGHAVIPTGGATGIIGAPGGELGMMRLSTPGIYAYAILKPRPPVAVELFVGWSGLPVLTYGPSVITATVDA